MLNNTEKTFGSRQIEQVLQGALNEKSIEGARPMDDAEILMLINTITAKEQDGIDTNSDFIHTTMEMANLALGQGIQTCNANHIHWARKMLRRFNEVFLVLSSPYKNQTIH
jgi:hypothetical protein